MNKTITLDRDEYEHLLNCLANQKFIHEVNADGLSEGEEKVKQMQSEAQQAIDTAWRKGMDLLHDTQERKDMANNRVIVCVGIPASGKTVWALQYCKDNPNTVRINKDSLRLMAYGEPYRPEWEDFICNLRDRIIDQSLHMEHDVVVDDTNGSQKHRKRIEVIANFYDATVEIKDFRYVPLEVCLERNKNRPNPVPEEAIHRIYDQLKGQEL